jgi:hypothetical protein
MADKEKDIRDDEFRVIGKERYDIVPVKGTATSVKDRASDKSRIWKPLAIILPLVILAGIAAVIFIRIKDKREAPEEGVFEPVPEVTAPANTVKIFGVETDSTFTERIDTVVNDVHLALYIPHNAVPELTLGVPDSTDCRIILAAQAADIRKDNAKILGAFVLKGEPLAWGLSKKGFCAIIEGKVTVGVSENSPLFEEATEKEGYFFRQYPLVDNGGLVESELKSKTMRKGLCSRRGQIFIAVSETDESMHDFAQALVDIGVENAVYLVGSHTSFGWYVDEAGERTIFGEHVYRWLYRNETYIIWR